MSDRACSRAKGTAFDPGGLLASVPDVGEQVGPQERVDVWIVDLDLDPSVAWSLRKSLSQVELARLERLREAVRKVRHTVAHAALRDVLASYLGIHPRELVFLSSAAGKPELAPEHGLSFNMSHSHARAVIAVSRGRRVGIDIEYAEGRRLNPVLIRQFLAPEEQQRLAAMSEGDASRMLLESWVRNEAYVKALGQGLPAPLRALSVGSPATIGETSDRDDESWLVAKLAVDKSYMAALVIEAGPLELAYRWWTPRGANFHGGVRHWPSPMRPAAAP